jgi:hypothetical protein
VQLLIQIALGFLPVVAAFILGILWKRLRITLIYFRARRFWRPVMTNDLQLVLGGFGDLRGFEASGLVGRGDVLAMDELIAYFEKIGYGKPRIAYGDQLGRADLLGDSLRTNMIILGGTDANSLTRDMVNQIKLGVDFVPTSVDEFQADRSVGEVKERRVRNLMRARGIKFGQPWRIPVIRDLVDQSGSTQPKVYRPSVKDGKVQSDYGLIIRAPNPFDPAKNVIILCGTYGYGTWAAVRFAQSREFLAELAKIRSARAIECVVGVDVVRESPQRLRPEFVRESPAGD